MTEPTTSNIGLTVPNTGDLAGAWGTAALNPNFQVIDGMFGGVLNLSFSSATTVTLTNNGAALTPGSGPFQTFNSALSLSGSLTGQVFINLPQPGVYRVFNNCLIGNSTSNVVQLRPSVGTGFACGVPFGEFRRFFYDGTNVYFMDMPHVGSYMNYSVKSTPSWILSSNPAPYLICNGQTYNVSAYPQLGSLLGSTWGGDGVTTFGVPDAQSRAYIMVDTNSVNRVTPGGSGISGTIVGATGGDQLMQSHTHNNTLNESPHLHTLPANVPAFGFGPTAGWQSNGLNGSLSQTNATTTGITITNVSAGSGGSQNMPPVYVGGITYIKT